MRHTWLCSIKSDGKVGIGETATPVGGLVRSGLTMLMQPVLLANAVAVFVNILRQRSK